MSCTNWPPLSYFISLFTSFSGWSLGVQRSSVFTSLPGLLKPTWEGAQGGTSSAIQADSCGLGTLLAFCVKQGISASFLSSILLTANSFLISLYIYISLSPHCPRFRYPGSNQGWSPVQNLLEKRKIEFEIGPEQEPRLLQCDFYCYYVSSSYCVKLIGFKLSNSRWSHSGQCELPY